MSVQTEQINGFNAEWDRAPRSMRNYVDQQVAEYWFLRGCQAGRTEGLRLQVDDAREMCRLVEGRLR